MKEPSGTQTCLIIDINKKTDEKPILYQASAFNEFPVYAPRYRQAHIRAYFTE